MKLTPTLLAVLLLAASSTALVLAILGTMLYAGIVIVGVEWLATR